MSVPLTPTVATGHPRVTATAVEVLRRGGNAFDAVVAAGFMGAVAEPLLTSLGGGGFLQVHTPGETVLVDFFVDTPGRGLPPEGTAEPHFEAVTIHFPAADQVFNIGRGSVAVPGCLAGYVEVHRRFGRLPLTEVVAPAATAADRGVEVTPQTAYLASLLAPIIGHTADSRRIFLPGGHLPRVGDLMTNPDLSMFLAELVSDPDLARSGFGHPALADRIESDMVAGGGLLTSEDLDAYRVVDREPLGVGFEGCSVLTNPGPSFGGSLMALGLRLLAEELDGAPWGSPAQAEALVRSMIRVDRIRGQGGSEEVTERLRSSGGTTQMTVADAEGNVASMTTSNGEGSSYVVPGTGVMLNNMLGEADLHPDGFHSAPPGERVSSMMAPSVVLDGDGEVLMALGSGGSKRIRTALVQVVAAVIVGGRSLERAVLAPRLHWDGDVVQMEPGFAPEVVETLRRQWPVNVWPQTNMYFGGVHAVAPGREAVGDPRRGGSARIGL